MRIDWRDPDGRPEGAVTRAAALRWTAAGLAVIAVHAGGIWLALNWPAAAEAPGDPPAAIMMELAPLAVAPEVPQQDIPPGPQMEEAEEEQPEPEKPVEEKPDPTPPEVKEAELKPPTPPKVEKAEVVLPTKVEPPKPKPKKKKQKKALAEFAGAARRSRRRARGRHGLVDVANVLARRADGAPQPSQALPVRRGGCGGCDGRVHDRPLRPRAVRAPGALGRRLRARCRSRLAAAPRQSRSRPAARCRRRFNHTRRSNQVQ
jgi:protein TonB